jgi:hypothetical protein
MTPVLESEVIITVIGIRQPGVEHMSERSITQGGEKVLEAAQRSHLLTPVVEGTPTESDDVAEFLAGRLSWVEEKDRERLLARLS